MLVQAADADTAVISAASPLDGDADAPHRGGGVMVSAVVGDARVAARARVGGGAVRPAAASL
jgi:hypothetical protein